MKFIPSIAIVCLALSVHFLHARTSYDRLQKIEKQLAIQRELLLELTQYEIDMLLHECDTHLDHAVNARRHLKSRAAEDDLTKIAEQKKSRAAKLEQLGNTLKEWAK